MMAESKGATRRRGGLPLLIEADLKLARFLAGLHVSWLGRGEAAVLYPRHLKPGNMHSRAVGGAAPIGDAWTLLVEGKSCKTATALWRLAARAGPAGDSRAARGV